MLERPRTLLRGLKVCLLRRVIAAVGRGRIALLRCWNEALGIRWIILVELILVKESLAFYYLLESCVGFILIDRE